MTPARPRPGATHLRRTAAAAVLLAAAAASVPAPALARCSGRAAPDPAVPAWEAVNGFALGSRPATAEELDRYLVRVDAASPRVRVLQAGTSAAGRPLRFALVSEPRALRPAALARLRARLARVVAGRTPAGAASGRAVVWLAGSVHGDEPSGADADARLLHGLAAGRDCATLRRLRALVVAVLPVQNPDGRAAGTRGSGAGFDLNRDWLAATQPETAATLRAVRALPPLAFVDQHEQAGRGAFAPPYARPVHHEVPAAARRAMARTFGPALRRALAAGGFDATGVGLDLLFPGYADSATTLLFGAAGMTVEAPAAEPFARRVALHAAAARAVLDAAAANAPALLRAWAAAARLTVAQGSRGAVQGRAGERTYGFALRADRRAADADALVAALLRAGVRVERLAAPARVGALRPWAGGAARGATLPAGTYVVPAAQGARRWAQAVLEADARPAPAVVADVSAWSLPLLAGLDGGALGTPLPARARRQQLARAPAPAPPPAAPAHVFPGDAAGSAGLALALLEGGAHVGRLPATGEFVVRAGAPTLLGGAARAHRTAVRPAGATVAAPAVALRRPRVALLVAPSASAGWARHALARLGVVAHTLGAGEAERLAGGGFTHLVVPDGPAPDLPPPALRAIAAWVHGGGTYVGWRARGVDVAVAAGLTSATRPPAPAGLHVAGAAVAVDLDRGSPLARAGRRIVVLDDADPPLRAGAGVAGRHAPAGEVLVSGLAAGTGALAGTPAVVDERAGAGRTILLSFDPAFRGVATGGLRLLAETLLG